MASAPKKSTGEYAKRDAAYALVTNDPTTNSRGAVSFVQARTAHEIAKAHLARLRLQRLRGELIDRARATALVFRLAREERDVWVNWPARVAALMAADLSAALSGSDDVTVGTGAMQQILESHVRAHLAEIAEPEFRL